MKKILVPTDFSPNAAKALDYAVSIAKIASAEIVLLHVSDREMAGDPSNEATGSGNDQLQMLQQGITKTENVTVSTRVVAGNTTEAILRAAEKTEADLVVMGTLGAAGLKRKLFGSQTAAIISKSHVPVLAVPFDYAWSVPKKILLAINDPREDAHLMKPVFEIANLFYSEVIVAIFSSRDYEAVDIMEHSRSINSIQRNLQKEYTTSNLKTVHLSGDDFSETLKDFIDRHHIDLLAMIAHERQGLDSILHKSMTKKMSYHTTVPLLALHATQH
jgi:nucleotide-binding universal stress UspA family protein